MKRIYYCGERGLEGLRWISKVIDFGVGLSVRATTNEMLNAYLYLRERSDLFRHRVKMLCNAAMGAAKHSETCIKSNMKSRDFWEAYCDRVIDSAERDILMLRIAVKQELDNVGCEDSDLLSRVETVRIMLDMSTKQYECAMEECRNKFGHNYFKDFEEYYMRTTLNAWDKMCDLLYSGIKVDLNTERVEKSFDAMCKKFAEGMFIDECLAEAQRQNPGFFNDIKVVQ